MSIQDENQIACKDILVSYMYYVLEKEKMWRKKRRNKR